MHLSALEGCVKYFFALDKLNYARMIPIYLAEMSQLERTYPEIWTEFTNGNPIANKNTLPFCAIGPDHALEQLNKWMKRTVGLVGITLNENERNQFFLISADLVWLTEEANEMTRNSEAARKRHHELSQAILKRQTKNFQKLVSTIEGFINPFSYQENDIMNLVTKTVMLEKVKQDMCLIEEVFLYDDTLH